MAQIGAHFETELTADLSRLFASDLSGRARSFQSMVKGGLDVTKAATLGRSHGGRMTTRADAPVLTRLATLRLLGKRGCGPDAVCLHASHRPPAAELCCRQLVRGPRRWGRPVSVNDIYENFTPEVLASVLVEARDIRLCSPWDANDQAINPNLILDGGQLFVYGPDDAVVTFTVDNSYVFGSDSAIAFDVSGGTLTGPDWTLAAGGDGDFRTQRDHVHSGRGGVYQGSMVSYLRAGRREWSAGHTGCRIQHRDSRVGRVPDPVHPTVGVRDDPDHHRRLPEDVDRHVQPGDPGQKVSVPGMLPIAWPAST